MRSLSSEIKVSTRETTVEENYPLCEQYGDQPFLLSPDDEVIIKMKNTRKKHYKNALQKYEGKYQKKDLKVLPGGVSG